MTTLNLPKFGKIKIGGEWCDFHESSVITGTISDDYCKIKIKEFEPKMNTYKIISGETYPTFEKLMTSQLEVKSASLREACCEFMKTKPGYEFFGYILNTETLNLFYVQYHRELNGKEYINQWYKGKLEKPKMSKYKIIPNQNKYLNSINYDFMMNYFTVDSDSPANAFRKYCECDSFVLNLDSNFGYVLDVESLDLYYASWSINEQIGHSSFVKKLEKHKMNTYKILPHCFNSTYEDFLNSDIEIFANSSKEAYIQYYKFTKDAILDVQVLNLKSLNVSYCCAKTNGFEKTVYFMECPSYTVAKPVEKPEVKPKMNKYKLIPNQNNLNPSYEEMMSSVYLIEADSPENALEQYREFNPKVNCGMVLNIDSLKLYRVLFDIHLNKYYDCFDKKLEKSEKMNKYKLSFKHKHVQDSTVVIEAHNPSEAVIKYCKQLQYTNIEMYAMNIETLNVFKVFWKQDINGKITTWTYQTNYKPEVKPKPMNNLSFKTLTEANNKRLPLFKNSKGLPAHSKPDGSDWSHAEWLQAVIGELGEYANIMKKVQRGDLTMEEAKPSIAKELADVQTYFSILAQQLGVDLGQAVEDKFNEVSKRVKANVFIKDDVVYSKEEKPISKDNEKLKAELGKVKVKGKNFPIITNDQLTNFIIGASVGYITNQVYGNRNVSTHVVREKSITLQDLNNGKVYTRPFISGQDSVTLQEFSKLIVTDATVIKTLINGKDYDGFNVNVGDMIQFSDDRNVLYSLRVTKIE